MMRYMPLMILVFLYNYSAGLALYWTVNNLLDGPADEAHEKHRGSRSRHSHGFALDAAVKKEKMKQCKM